MLLNFLLSGLISLVSLSDSNSVVNNIAADSVTINSIYITGNKKTKERVIIREITLKTGTTYSKETIQKEILQSQRNVFNTGLFNFVTIKDSLNNIYVNVVERWYIWPIPIIQFADQNINVWWKTKDLKRLNYGAYLAYRNFTGNRDFLFLRYQTGFTNKYEVAYQFPNIDKKQQFGLATKVFYSQSKKQAFDTQNDKQFFPDVDSENFKSTQFLSQFAIDFRKKIFIKHNFSVTYSSFKSSDSIAITNPNYLGFGKSNTSYLQIGYTYTYDKRNNKSYPLTGNFFETKANTFFVFNNPNTYQITSEYRQHYQILINLYGATGLKIKTAPNSQQPYIFQNALGYSNSEVGFNNFVRSYEFNVIDGQHYFLAKTDLKFPLLVNKVKTVNSITSEFGQIPYAFYLTAYSDAGYVKNSNPNISNKLNNKLLVSYGIGINYVTYYDLVYRIEYSVNNTGGKGFFVNFVIPI